MSHLKDFSGSQKEDKADRLEPPLLLQLQRPTLMFWESPVSYSPRPVTPLNVASHILYAAAFANNLLLL